LQVHVEVQACVERKFGRRKFRDDIRCFELYDRRVISLTILCDDDADWQPEGFSYGGFGNRAGIHFPTVKLLDYVGREGELAASDNPVAQVVLAHLAARATREQPEDRRTRKLRMVKELYQRGWSAEDVRQLIRVIDWLMELPAELQEEFRQQVHAFEQEQHMPYVTSFERLAKKEGRREGRREGPAGRTPRRRPHGTVGHDSRRLGGAVRCRWISPHAQGPCHPGIAKASQAGAGLVPGRVTRCFPPIPRRVA
jgi:hypothetical protein